MTTFPVPAVTNGYVSFPVTVNPNALIQAAFAAIKAQIPGWQPQEGQLDVAVIEETAQMVSVVAQVAAQMAIMAFETYGRLVGVTPILGVQATAPVTFTMTNDAGYTIPAGTVVAYPLSGNSQILFTVKTTIVIASGTTTGTGTLVCRTVGTFPNGLTATTCQMVTTFAQVATVATTAAVSGGIAADTQTSYINRLAAELRLMAPRPILPADFAAMAQNVPGVYRALAIGGLSPGRTVTGCATTSTSKTVTATSGAFTTADVGRSVTGSGIPSTTVVTAINSSTSVKLSKAATATATGVSLTFGDLTTQQRYVTVCGLTTTGTALSTTVNAEMVSYLDAKREVNFVVASVKPTYTEIDVTVTCDAVIGGTTSAIQTAVAAALTAFLDKATWGGGNAQTPQWTPASNVVRFLDVANVIHSTAGVLYIPSGSLTTRIHGGSMGTSDINLPGDAPLPTAGTILVTVEAS